MKQYLNVKGSSENKVRLEMRYNLGGINYATYKEEPRGYYLHVTPVKLEERGGWKSESCMMFSGYKQLVESVSRKSKSAEARAEKNAESVKQQIIDKVLAENGWELE